MKHGAKNRSKLDTDCHIVINTDSHMTDRRWQANRVTDSCCMFTWKINGSYLRQRIHCIDSPTAFEWARAIQKHYLKVICAIGLPGNLAAILTIMTKRSWRTAGILLALLAASDSAALVTKLVLNQLSFSLDPFPVHFCRSLVLTNLFSLYANWLLVVISAERTDALVYAPAHRGGFDSLARPESTESAS